MEGWRLTGWRGCLVQALTYWKTVTAVAAVEDVQEDLADIARLLEAYPDLRGQVPADLVVRLV